MAGKATVLADVLTYAYLDQISKNALIDLVFDFLCRCNGELDGEEAVKLLESTYLPVVLRHRGDRMPDAAKARGRVRSAEQWAIRRAELEAKAKEGQQ